jgi:hypothetical protein
VLAQRAITYFSAEHLITYLVEHLELFGPTGLLHSAGVVGLQSRSFLVRDRPLSPATLPSRLLDCDGFRYGLLYGFRYGLLCGFRYGLLYGFRYYGFRYYGFRYYGFRYGLPSALLLLLALLLLQQQLRIAQFLLLAPPLRTAQWLRDL